MAKTQGYIVTQKHTLGHKIGDEVKLTDHQAKSLVGKVRLKKDGTIDKAKADLVIELKKAVASLGEVNVELVAEVELLNECGEKVGKECDRLTEENEKLTAEIELLKKPVKEKGEK